MPSIHPFLRRGACVLLVLLGNQARADQSGDTAVAQSTEAADRQSLLQAWEKEQKNDPLTITFEQTAPGVYHLKTTRFPYDGTVRVTSMVIHSMPNASGDSAGKYGVVEPTLDQDNAKYASQYPESFGEWQARNYFHYSPALKAWTSNADTPVTPVPTSRFSPFLSFQLLIGGFALLFIALAILRVREWRVVQKRFKQAEKMEKRAEESQQRVIESRERALQAYALQEKNHELFLEQTRLLREILDTLKQKS